MKIAFTTRCRQYGYFIWHQDQDKEILRLIPQNTEKLDVYLGENYLGKKSVDWKYRRISLGYKYTRPLPEEVEVLVASRNKDGGLVIKWK